MGFCNSVLGSAGGADGKTLVPHLGTGLADGGPQMLAKDTLLKTSRGNYEKRGHKKPSSTSSASDRGLAADRV